MDHACVVFVRLVIMPVSKVLGLYNDSQITLTAFLGLLAHNVPVLLLLWHVCLLYLYCDLIALLILWLDCSTYIMTWLLYLYCDLIALLILWLDCSTYIVTWLLYLYCDLIALLILWFDCSTYIETFSINNTSTVTRFNMTMPWGQKLHI